MTFVCVLHADLTLVSQSMNHYPQPHNYSSLSSVSQIFSLSSSPNMSSNSHNGIQSKKWSVISLAQAFFLKCIAQIGNKRSPFSSQMLDFYKNVQQCLQDDLALAIVHVLDILDGVPNCHKCDGTKRLCGKLLISNCILSLECESQVRPRRVRPVRWQIKDCQTTEPRTFDSGFSTTKLDSEFLLDRFPPTTLHNGKTIFVYLIHR